MTDRQHEVIEKAISVICYYYECEKEDVFTKSHKRPAPERKQVFVYLCLDNCNFYNNYGELGEFMGYASKNRHSMIIHAKKTVENFIEVDKEYREKVQHMAELMKNDVILSKETKAMLIGLEI